MIDDALSCYRDTRDKRYMFVIVHVMMSNEYHVDKCDNIRLCESIIAYVNATLNDDEHELIYELNEQHEYV